MCAFFKSCRTCRGRLCGKACTGACSCSCSSCSDSSPSCSMEMSPMSYLGALLSYPGGRRSSAYNTAEGWSENVSFFLLVSFRLFLHKVCVYFTVGPSVSSASAFFSNQTRWLLSGRCGFWLLWLLVDDSALLHQRRCAGWRHANQLGSLLLNGFPVRCGLNKDYCRLR